MWNSTQIVCFKQFPLDLTPWPTTGMRRISVNSFGFGGTNAHAVLDDAHHYLKLRGIPSHLLISADDYSLTNGTTSGANGTHRQNGTEFESTTGAANGSSAFQNQKSTNSETPSRSMSSVNNVYSQTGTETADSEASSIPPNSAKVVHAHSYTDSKLRCDTTNCVTGIDAQNDTESKVQPCIVNDVSRVQKPSLPKILTFSAMDENSLKRLSSLYDSYFTSLDPTKGSDGYFDALVHTLNNRRTSLLWRSFALARSVSELQSQGLKLSKPRRMKSNPQLAFCFTGQGAQWFAMGRELLSFPVFKNSLEDMDAYLSKLGCSWALLGKVNQTLGSPFSDPQQMSFVEIRLARRLTNLHTASHCVPLYK